MPKRNKKGIATHHFTPQGMMVLGFMAAILIGTLLLSLPSAVPSATPPLTPITALFTATSAICVTGLSVIDIGTELSSFGQTTVLLLIQLGGLGIATLGTFLLLLIGKRLSLQSEFALMHTYGKDGIRGIKPMLLWSIGTTLLFETIGAATLYQRYLAASPHTPLPDSTTPLFSAIFHSISAFCNAGFSLHPDSLQSFRHDPLFLITIQILIITGGLGFIVLYNLATIRFWRRDIKSRGRLTLHSRITLTATAALLLTGFATFLLQEWGNTLADLSFTHKLTCSLFHSVTPRSAGFSAIPFDQVSHTTRFTSTLLMLVGGSPGSAAGGIRTTTLFVLIATITALCRNRRETTIFSRTIPNTVVRKSIVIFLMALTLIASTFGLLLWSEAPFTTGDSERWFFESVAAATTVGLSLGQTPTLSTAGRLVIIVCMFIGRLGPLTIALLLGNRDEAERIRFPEEEVAVG